MSQVGVNQIKAGGSVSNKFADDTDLDSNDSNSFAIGRRLL